MVFFQIISIPRLLKDNEKKKQSKTVTKRLNINGDWCFNKFVLEKINEREPNGSQNNYMNIKVTKYKFYLQHKIANE